MKYRKGIKSLNISKNDIIDLQTSYSEEYSKYLILNINMAQKYILLLPIDEVLGGSNAYDVIPSLTMPFNIIKKIKKDKKTSIFYLLNQNNPHIINAIESKMLE